MRLLGEPLGGWGKRPPCSLHVGRMASLPLLLVEPGPLPAARGAAGLRHLGLYRPPFPPTAPPRVPLCPPTQGARTVALSLSCQQGPRSAWQFS